MQMLKSELRKKLINERKNFDLAIKAQWDDEVFHQIIQLDAFKCADIVLTYTSTEIEVDTMQLIRYCIDHGKRVAVPVWDLQMDFFEIASLDDLEIGKMNILVPKNPLHRIEDFEKSICIVPALAFDEKGFRLGYGKGYYDRFLCHYSGFSLGICYDSFIQPVPIEQHDFSVDMIVTNNGGLYGEG